MTQKAQNPVEQAVWDALTEVMDVEVGVSIVDLGLVYKVIVSGDRAGVDITTTSPSCPVHVSMAEEVRQVILRKVPSLSEVEVQVVRDPPWTPERMSEAAKNLLGGG
jgi:metal-sulfur cluster biosynthetic enzyme